MPRLPLAAAAALALLPIVASAQQADPVTPRTSTNSGTRERPMTMAAPVLPPDMSPAIMRQGGGSLLQAGRMSYAATPGGSLMVGPGPAGAGGGGDGGRAPDPTRAAIRAYSPFAVGEPEPKLVKKRDLVTIIIREESEASSQGTTDLKRESVVDAHADQFVRFDLANKALIPTIGGASPAVNLTGNRSFKGEGTASRQDSFITRITAEVLDVKPNGTLVLQARKKIKNDEEEQTFVCAGVCRVEDITPDNTVLSTQLFDLEVSKTAKGQVRNSTKTGLLHKLLDFVNLF